jgi:hypothetical protein
MKYTIIRSALSTVSLTHLIQSRLDEGWVLAGGVSSIMVNTGIAVRLLEQADKRDHVLETFQFIGSLEPETMIPVFFQAMTHPAEWTDGEASVGFPVNYDTTECGGIEGERAEDDEFDDDPLLKLCHTGK